MSLRANRLTLALIALLVLTGVPAPLALADDRGVISLQATQPSAEDFNPGLVQGGPCSLYTIDSEIRFRTVARFIVRDDSGKIIAVQKLDQGTGDAPMKDDFFRCNTTVEIAIGDSPFYSVWLDNRYLTTLTRDELPLQSPLSIELPSE